MRDNLAKANDALRWRIVHGWDIDMNEATVLFGKSERHRLRGENVTDVYGTLCYYTQEETLTDFIQPSGWIGLPRIAGGGGVFLTPTRYAADIAPYNLGLNRPVDVCLELNIPDDLELWGPGTSRCHPQCDWKSIWEGGAIEFFSPDPIPTTAIVRTINLAPDGERHLVKGVLLP